NKQSVALNVISLERRRASRGVGIVMLHDCLRNVQALPAGPARAQAKIGIFAIKEKTAVESAGLIEHGAAVKGGGAGGQQDLFCDGKVVRHAAMSALFTAGVSGDQHAGGI